jgi:hypothetical protein
MQTAFGLSQLKASRLCCEGAACAGTDRGSTTLTLGYSESGEMPPGSGSGSYIDTSSVTPGVSLPLVPAIRISIPSPSTNVACAVLPAMRIAT